MSELWAQMESVKTIIALAVCLALLLTGCAGAGFFDQTTTTEDTKTEATKDTAPVASDDFYATFSAMLDAAGMDIQKRELSTGNLSDYYINSPGEPCITLTLESDTAGRVASISLLTERKRTNLSYAVVCLYAFRAMGAPDVDAQEFYDELGLLSDDDGPKDLTLDGVHIGVLTSTEYRTAIAYYLD